MQQNNYPEKKTCALCRQSDCVGIMLDDTWDYHYNLRIYKIEGLHCYYCNKCGEKLLNPDMCRHNESIIKRILEES